MYAVKIYTIDGVLIYQAELGATNGGKIPLGGVIVQGSSAESMLDAIANPITYYGSYSVISQSGHSGDLYNYYWSSYSRGTDGKDGNTKWHNDYLDGYIPLRVKSIYDPCPYLYRIPSNGSWNQFGLNAGWTRNSYLGGASLNINTLGESWFLGSGRCGGTSAFEYTGFWGYYFSSTPVSQGTGYVFGFIADKRIYPNRYDLARSLGLSVRCIEELRSSNNKVENDTL